MSTRFFRSKFAVTGVVAFVGGVIFASSMDLTKYSWAQPTKSTAVQPTVRGPNAPDAVGSFANVAERVTPTVVAINTLREARQIRANPRGRPQVPQGMEDFFNQFGGGGGQPRDQRGEGSGFIMTADGYIITNNHVVADADRVTVTLSDQRIFNAKVVGRDSTTDVAVVKIDAKGLPTLPIGDDNQARIGDWVLAVGNPLGLEFTVTAGIISAKSRGSELGASRGGMNVSDFIQTDAAINPGNSGGPLINLKGEAVGLNSMIASETGYYSGYGFAIPITLVKQVADALIKEGRVRLPVLGVTVDAVSAEDAGINGLTTNSGVKVQGFNPPNAGPAKEAGILPGDLIMAIGGEPVSRVSQLQRVVRSHQVGETVTVDVLRYGSKKQFKVKLIEANAAPIRLTSNETSTPDVVPAPVSKNIGKFGIAVETVSAEQARTWQLPAGGGVRVTEIASNSPAKDKLNPGNDIVTEVLFPGPRRAIKTAAELEAILNGLKDGEYVSLMVTTVIPERRFISQPTVVNIRAN